MTVSHTASPKPFTEPPQRRQRRGPKGLLVSSKKTNDPNSLKMRLAGLSPLDIHKDGVAIFMPFPMEVPPEFEAVSHVIGDHNGFMSAASQLRKVPIALTFCDISNDEGMQLVQGLASFLRQSLGAKERPSMVLVPLQCEAKDTGKEIALLSDAIKAGFDGIIPGTSTGLKFALDAHTEAMKHCSIKDKVQHTKDVVEDLIETMDLTMWQYLPCKLGLQATIPQMDPDLHLFEPGALIGGNFTLGKLIDQGARGSVYKLENPARPGAETGEVVKVIDKESISRLKELKKLSHEIEMMQAISSDDWKHPNIIQLSEVYHSAEHVLLRMQDGGPCNLFRYLHALDSKKIPLWLPIATTIITQSLSAVCHLHLGLNMAHRDIKPENITIAECDTNGVLIRLCDFDLARILPDNSQCVEFVGTFPFNAPEMLQPPFDAFPTDIWSLGIVFLEAMCGCDVIMKSALKGKNFRKNPGTQSERKIMTAMIGDYFHRSGSVSNLLDVHRPELKHQVENLTVPITSMMEGMLSVAVDHRSTAADLKSMC